MTSTGLLASAPNKEALEKCINGYFYSTSYFINEDLKVESSKDHRILDSYKIEVKRGRWRFAIKTA